MKAVLVTGGCGYIGSHTSVELLKNDFFVYIVDSNINSSEDVIEKINKTVMHDLEKDLSQNLEFIKGDIRDSNLLKSIFLKAQKENNEISSVIHFAGLKSVEESIKEPIKYWDFNLGGTISLIKVMQKFECKSLIFSSSATIYEPGEELINENAKISPINPYGNTKAAIERVLDDLFNGFSSDWRIANLRYFNPIGAHSSGIIGEYPKGKPTNIYPLIVRVAKKELSELQIFGNNWETIDGTGVRDYIHVVDLAQGHIRTLNYIQNKEPETITINLGTGVGTSVLELIRTFEKVNKVTVPYKFTSKRKGDLGYVVADNSLATKLLNWQPTKSVKDMCRDGWK